jgi:hypothetical protein
VSTRSHGCLPRSCCSSESSRGLHRAQRAAAARSAAARVARAGAGPRPDRGRPDDPDRAGPGDALGQAACLRPPGGGGGRSTLASLSGWPIAANSRRRAPSRNFARRLRWAGPPGVGSFLPSGYRRSRLIVRIVRVSAPPKTYPPVRTAAAGVWPLRQPRNPPAVPTSRANTRPRANHTGSRSSFAGGLGDLANVLSSISYVRPPDPAECL